MSMCLSCRSSFIPPRDNVVFIYYLCPLGETETESMVSSQRVNRRPHTKPATLTRHEFGESFRGGDYFVLMRAGWICVPNVLFKNSKKANRYAAFFYALIVHTQGFDINANHYSNCPAHCESFWFTRIVPLKLRSAIEWTWAARRKAGCSGRTPPPAFIPGNYQF